MTRVLVVDDSPVMRHYVARTLQMTGIEMTIDEAGNGAIAIDKALASRPDVIITDLNMPEMSGQELIARVHGAAELQATKVVVLSADCSAGRPDEAMRAGASAYLTKPVTPETLKGILLNLLPEPCLGVKA
jgi:two-component system chemotaxis response regulator CheY